MPGGLRRERLDRALARASDAPLREGNKLEILRNGPDTYDDWLEAIAKAKRWVHLDNYIFKDDEVGERFAQALISKAKEGTSVRVLYDWFGCLDVRRSFWRRMRKAGVDASSLVGLRFPRVFAWPLAAAGALYGGLGILRAARSAISDRRSRPPALLEVEDAGS